MSSAPANQPPSVSPGQTQPPGRIPSPSNPATIRIGSERRREMRRLAQTKAILTVLDGPLANTTHEIMTRDLSLSGVSFLLRQPLAIGQVCRLDILSNGSSGSRASHLCEVVRSRPLSNGKHEMAVKFRDK
ncbi:PilZ domain-containing protein [Fontivita pretiosa]|uniref:PilZ domain-containing protein n=1 Tax=Fontivita pretiosa TaxID=2989684 RepID=UPI003D16FEFE